MTESHFRIRSGPFKRGELSAWLNAIMRAYPDYDKDDAARMIVSSLEVELLVGTQFQRILCFDGEFPVGLLKYLVVDNGRRIELHYFAVLSSHQRRGIGTSLLDQIKAKASGRASIFASGIFDPAHIPLQRAGSWP